MAIQFLTDVNADSGTLYVDSINDRVGIGVSTPSTKLHVIGTVRGGGSTNYVELDTNGNIKLADSSAAILPVTSGSSSLSIGANFTSVWDTIRYYFDNEVVWNPGVFGAADDMNLDTSGNLSIAGDLTVNGGDITLVGTGRIQGIDTVSASTDAVNKAYVDANIPSGGPFLPLQPGGSDVITADVRVNPNVYLRYGAGANQMGVLRIGYDSSSNYSNISSSSQLLIKANDLVLASNYGTPETYIDCNANSSVDLYHNNVKKFQTLSTGASVTGRLGIETTNPNYELDVNGTANVTNLRVSGSQGSDGQVLTSTGSGVAWEDGGGGDFLPLNPTGSDVMTGDVRIAENKYFRFGASANAAGSLIIGHTNFGSPYSQILENGTGDLKISATNLILESANAETYIDCNFNSSVDLYHNNVKKFETLSTGVAVTGKLGIDTTSPNAQLDVFNNSDQTSTLRLSTSDNSAGNVSGEISFALDGTTVGAKIQSIINANEDGTDLKLDSTNTTLTGDLTVSGGDISLSGTGRIQGVDTVSASTDAANKAYVDAHTPANTQTIITSNFSDDTNTMNSLRIPFNTLVETTSNQYYNSFDCPADGSIKRVRFHNTSGSASTSFSINFQIYKNASYSSPTTSGNIAVSSGQVEWEPSSYTFSKGDSLQFGYAKSATGKYLRGVSATIIVEFEQV